MVLSLKEGIRAGVFAVKVKKFKQLKFKPLPPILENLKSKTKNLRKKLKELLKGISTFLNLEKKNAIKKYLGLGPLALITKLVEVGSSL